MDLIDLSLIQGGCISGLETNEIDHLMESAMRTGTSLNQFNGFNDQQGEDFQNLMRILEETDGDNNSHILPPEAENIINEELNSAKNKTTAAQTKQYVEKFRNFLRRENLPTEFEDSPDIYLLKYLQFWLVSARRQDGKRFSPSTYTCMRAAIHRHLVETKNRPIIGNIKFSVLDTTLKACISAYLKEPKQTQDSGYKAIEPTDMEKLKAYFNRTTPTRLLWEVFFLIIYHFGFRGREWLRSLKKDSVLINHCPTANLKYVDLVKERKEKNVNQNNPNSCKQIVMYEIPHSNNCPVKAVELYLSKLPTGSNVLFPKPKARNYENEWYSNKEVLGKHKLFDGMKLISELANLSTIYTNHCIRASVVTTLSEKGFSPSEIQTVTGQKRIETIEKYTKRISSCKKMKLSHALSSGLDGSVSDIPSCSTSMSCVTNTVKVTQQEIGTNESETEKEPTLIIEKNGARVKVYL